MAETPIETDAIVSARISALAYLLILPNGKTATGHLSRVLRTATPPPVFPSGHRVHVEMTPYDFSRARIVGSSKAGCAIKGESIIDET